MNPDFSSSGVRLQKLIAERGLASRREAERLISEGRVSVNGKPVNRQGLRVDPEHDQVIVDGRTLPPETAVRQLTILLHKPTGCLTSLKDPAGRRLVSDYFPAIKERIYPIGRLDFNTSGLLLCTNDGELANRLMHPRYKIEKEYLVTVKGFFRDDDLARLHKGLQLEDGPTKAIRASLDERSREVSRLRLVIGEGRNRQVRRMMQALSYRVEALARTGYAFLSLQGVKQGKWRRLSEAEVDRLNALASGGHKK